MWNTAKRLHKSVKNKERDAKLHKSVIDDIRIRSIFAYKSRNKKHYGKTESEEQENLAGLGSGGFLCWC